MLVYLLSITLTSNRNVYEMYNTPRLRKLLFKSLLSFYLSLLFYVRRGRGKINKRVIQQRQLIDYFILQTELYNTI